MTIQPIGPSVLVLFLSLNELEERGLQPEYLTESDTLELAREGLSLSNHPADEPLELESYPDKSGLLLFIHTSPTARVVWRFFDSDALLDALPMARALDHCPVYWWKDFFWLISDCSYTPQLSEFADCIADDPLLSARLAEYALPVSL